MKNYIAQHKDKMAGVALAVVSSATFGLIPLFTLPLMQRGMAVPSIMFFRFVLSSLFMGTLLAVKEGDFKLRWSQLFYLMALGMFYAVTSIFLTSAYQYLPSGVAVSVHFLYPVLVTLIMILFFHERGSVPLYLAIAAAVAGVCLLNYTGSEAAFSVRGLVLVLTTVVAYALYLVGVQRGKAAHMSSLKLTFYILLVCTFYFGVNMCADPQPITLPTGSNVWNIVMLALVPTLVSDLTLVMAVKKVGPTVTAILGCFEPVTAVMVGCTLFAEQLTGVQLVGIAVINLAVMAVIYLNRPQKK